MQVKTNLMLSLYPLIPESSGMPWWKYQLFQWILTLLDKKEFQPGTENLAKYTS